MPCIKVTKDNISSNNIINNNNRIEIVWSYSDWLRPVGPVLESRKEK